MKSNLSLRRRRKKKGPCRLSQKIRYVKEERDDLLRVPGKKQEKGGARCHQPAYLRISWEKDLK